MWSFFKKDLIVFWRDRKGFLLSLFLPIVLIVVLNFAYAGLFTSDDHSVNIRLGIVQEDDPVSDMQEFEALVEEMELMEEEKDELLQQAAIHEPGTVLYHILHRPEFKDWLDMRELSMEEAVSQVEEGKLDAYMRIPARFTLDVLRAGVLGDEVGALISIHAEEYSTEVQTLQEMINQFVNSLNFQFALENTNESNGGEPVLPIGGVERIESSEAYTMAQYFTIAVATLFSLFIAQTVAMKTVTEKRERVFNRIVLSNSSPFAFLMGKMASTFCFCWFQIMLTLMVTQLFLNIFPDHSIQFWSGLVLIISVFVLTVSGLSALFTTITLRLQNLNAANGIFSLIIMLMGLLGGSFFPLQGLPVVFQKMGDWTPNGLIQTVLIDWIQNRMYSNLLMPLLVLVLFFSIVLAVSLVLFPRRESL